MRFSQTLTTPLLSFILMLGMTNSTLAIEGDITGNGAVDLNDVNAISVNWLNNNCSAGNGWCGNADINKSGSVDFIDFALLANNWLKPPIADWLKGNIHYHTTNSDGGETLATMIAAYRDSGENKFSCVTDHDYISNADLNTTSTFLGVNGVEASANGSHVVGFGMASPLGVYDPNSGLQGHINNIIAGGGLPMVAHPLWSKESDSSHWDMPALLANMTGCNLISVFNWYCQDLYGNGNSEAYWDTLLTSGKTIYGYAEDDAHGLGRAGFTFNRVGVSSLTLDDIKAALQTGNFYFGYTPTKWGNGITVSNYIVSGTGAGDTISITANSATTIKFIGQSGSVLQITNAASATYTITGNEPYVRIKATNTAGDITWMQPVIIGGSGPPPPPPSQEFEGYTPLATGGEGGTVVHVANLNDSGAGSFRAAVAGLSGSPTTIVFDVGGAICVSSEIRITKTNVTIDGSTAPSPGITLIGSGAYAILGIDIDGTANVIVQHLRFRNSGSEGIQIWEGGQIIIDHCSISGSGDGALDINTANHLVISRCLFGSNTEVHKAHGTYISAHHNLYVWNNRRQPRVFEAGPYWDFRNNVVEHWTGTGTNILYSDAVNVVNNWYGDPSPLAGCNGGFLNLTSATNVYTNGNYSNCGQNIDAVGNVSIPNTEPNVTTIAANLVPASVLSDVGAQPTDAIDQYYINGGGDNPPAVGACGGGGGGGGGGGEATFLSDDAKDGYVLESTETSGVGGSINVNSSWVGDSTDKQQYVSILSFDTSSIPDNVTITSATLTIKRLGMKGTPSSLGTLTADIKNGTYGTITLQTTDFEAASSATNVVTIAIPSKNGTTSTGALNSSGLANINKSGYTQFKLHFALDDNNDSTTDHLELYDNQDNPSLNVIWQ